MYIVQYYKNKDKPFLGYLLSWYEHRDLTYLGWGKNRLEIIVLVFVQLYI